MSRNLFDLGLDAADLLESAPDAMVLADENGIIVMVNTQAEKMFGYPRAELLGQPVEMLVPERFRADHPTHRAAYFREPRVLSMGERRELFGQRKDGSEFQAEISLSPLKTDKGLVVSTSIRDITARKQARKSLEDQFRQAQKMEAIGRLAGGVAHDFNNLLTVILGYSDILLSNLVQDDPNRPMVEQVRAAGHQAASLTKQLLAFSRKQMLVTAVFDLNNLLVDMEKMLARLIGEDIYIVFSRGQSLWRVKTDPGQMEQVIMNLVVNSRDAMPGGGKLIIETANVDLSGACAQSHAEAAPGQFVRLTVSDNGCGMDEEMRTRMFEPFFTTKVPEKGTGLGLSMVFGIVKQSGGNIEVSSEPGVGTSITIYLPRAADDISRSSPSTEQKPSGRGKETVLLADDDEGIRALAKFILEKAGYCVLEATCGDEALLIYRQNPGAIDIIVTDVVMPGLSGPQLISTLEQTQARPKVVYLSGYTDEAMVHDGTDAAGTAYLQKPFAAADLLRIVRETLGK